MTTIDSFGGRVPDFTFAKFLFHAQIWERLRLPEYKGSTLRGGFGHVFKKVCCISPPGKCRDNCQKPESCAYAYVFETPSVAKHGDPIQATNLPHPFVFLPPITKKEYVERGKPFSFAVTLFGKGIDFLPFFVYAFDELGRRGLGRDRGKYLLYRVDDPDGKEIYTAETRTLQGDFGIYRLEKLFELAAQKPREELTVEFRTPTRITNRNKFVDTLPFELLMRNVLRRASLLAKIHGMHEWQLDYPALLQKAQDVQLVQNNLNWYDWERYSSRQQSRMKLGGFTGRVKYEGDLSLFLPFIFLGQFIHIGKNTTFGMGNYKIIG